MKVSKQYIRQLILEELTKSDVRDIVKDEFKKQNVKTDVGEIAKEVLKKLYKDLAYRHPYIIDRIKV